MNFTFVLDCQDPDRLAEFWAPALGYESAGRADPYVALVAEGRPMILLQQVSEAKVGKNRMHLDLHPERIEPETERLVALGAKQISDSVLSEHGHRWVVMADPEGNEFCICDNQG